MQQVTLKVEGMTCGHCVSSVEGAIKNVGATGQVDLSAKTVQVTFDESKLTLDTIKEAIENQGYDVG